jgi:hypothetical protein
MQERAEIHFEPGGHFPFPSHVLPFLDKWLKKIMLDKKYKDEKSIFNNICLGSRRYTAVYGM